MMPRPETGPMRFGDDWTGIFIRGDNAFSFSMALNTVLHKAAINEPLNGLDVAYLKSLKDLLDSCNEHNHPEVRVSAQEAVLLQNLKDVTDANPRAL